MVANSLSWENYHSDDKLTCLLTFLHLPQVLSNSSIVWFPSKIVLWLNSLLHRLSLKPKLQEAHTGTKHECDDDALANVDPLALGKPVSSWIHPKIWPQLLESICHGFIGGTILTPSLLSISWGNILHCHFTMILTFWNLEEWYPPKDDDDKLGSLLQQLFWGLQNSNESLTQ